MILYHDLSSANASPDHDVAQLQQIQDVSLVVVARGVPTVTSRPSGSPDVMDQDTGIRDKYQ